jgi:hypothetical protein
LYRFHFRGGIKKGRTFSSPLFLLIIVPLDAG